MNQQNYYCSCGQVWSDYQSYNNHQRANQQCQDNYQQQRGLSQFPNVTSYELANKIDQLRSEIRSQHLEILSLLTKLVKENT